MKAAGGTFVLRLFYLASGFITTLLLTRWLGAEGFGVYNFVISWIVLSVILVKFGFEDFLVRETAAVQAKGNYEAASRLWRFALGFIACTSLLAMSIFAASLMLLTFENPHLKITFVIGIVMIPLLGAIGIFRGRFRANKLIVNSQVPEYLIRPILLTIVLAVMLFTDVSGQPELAIAINVGATIAALAYCVFSGRDVKVKMDEASPSVQHSGETIRKTASYWILGALPFVMIAGIHIINQRADRLMLGTMLDMKSVGYYSVAAQMAMVVNFTLLGINQAVGPLVAERHESNRGQELQQTLIRVTLYATIGSVLIVGALALFGGWVLNIFGDDFQHSYLPMLILAVGQLANVAAGPAGTILAMSKKERLVGVGILASAIVNLILNALLIPVMGIIGAATATAISMATWNVLLVVFAKRKLGINSNMWAFLVPSRQAS